MKPKIKREIKFILSSEEIKLLTRVRQDFSKEFSGRNLSNAKYEFTYSYEALYQLGFDVMGAAFFTVPRKLKPQYNRLSKKITRLVRLSEDFSAAGKGWIGPNGSR